MHVNPANILAGTLVGFLVALVVVLPHWLVFRKAGFSGWLGVTQVVPVLNVLVMYYFAFEEWPLQRDLKALREAGRKPDSGPVT